jgi:hypothetical protein
MVGTQYHYPLPEDYGVGMLRGSKEATKWTVREGEQESRKSL